MCHRVEAKQTRPGKYPHRNRNLALAVKVSKRSEPLRKWTGTDTIEIQADAIARGQRVVVLDDLVATGGTMRAAIDLVRQRGGEVVAAACIIELSFLRGRDRIDVPFSSMVAFDA